MLSLLLISTPWYPINVFRLFVPSVSLGTLECSCWVWLWTKMTTIYYLTCIIVISPFYATTTSFLVLNQCSWTLSQKIEFLIFFQPISAAHLTCWTTGGAKVSTFVRFERFTIILAFQWPSIFLLEDTRLPLKKPSSSLLPNLSLVAPVQVWLRYLVPLQTPLSQESSKLQSNYSTIRQMGLYTAIACSVGFICFQILWRRFGAN